MLRFGLPAVAADPSLSAPAIFRSTPPVVNPPLPSWATDAEPTLTTFWVATLFN